MKTVDFSETIVACDLKVGRCRQLIEFMKACGLKLIELYLLFIFFDCGLTSRLTIFQSC